MLINKPKDVLKREKTLLQKMISAQEKSTDLLSWFNDALLPKKYVYKNKHMAPIFSTAEQNHPLG